MLNRMSKEEATKAIKAIASSPEASYWLKYAVESSLKRDCVDALHDAQTLTMILQAQCAN